MVKSDLRKEASKLRSKISEREKLDKKIFNNVISLEEFKDAETVLIYVSYKTEPETDSLIEYCFKNGKRVAVPCCKDEDGDMDFYIIDSFDSIEPKTFGIREPNTESCEKLTDFSGSLLIVPGLCFGENGSRLGYGKGYYDRFLKKYSFISVGLCYNMLINNNIPTDEFDEKVDIIVSEKSIIRVNNGGKNE